MPKRVSTPVFLAFVAGALCLIAACVQTAPAIPEQILRPPVSPQASARINADVAFLADDARAGRKAGTAGYDDAAAYVAARLDEMGLVPFGDDGRWRQETSLRSWTEVLSSSSLSIVGPGGESRALTSYEDFRIYQSPERQSASITAPAVFVGYGVHAPELGHDDLAGRDLAGKVAVYFIGAPATLDDDAWRYYQSRSVKMAALAERGAIGVIEVQTFAGAELTPWARFQRNPKRAQMTWLRPDGRAENRASGIALRAVMHPESTPLLFEGAPRTFSELLEETDDPYAAPEGFDLAVEISMKGAARFEDVESANVVGLIDGADPQLRNEYVVLTAHLDHLGLDEDLEEAGEDGVYNGALDNAIGVAVMLEVAHNLMQASPKRSVIVLATTAEEKGLIGADYFVNNPPVPIDTIVANVNLDMPLMLYPFTDMVAFGAERSSLGSIAKMAVEAAGFVLAPDPLPEEGLFTRSDHYRFVEKGVPAIFLIPGFANGGEAVFRSFLAEHYHEPSDDAEQPILYDEAARFATINTMIARDIANAPSRPEWREGDFFGDMFSRVGR